MSNGNTTAPATAATDASREQLLNLIGGRLERVRATPEVLIDWFQESIDLLEEVEAWTVAHHPDGYLILRDPADEITMESI
ncbi:hypothetical protein [Ensifer sp. OV372]|uniref:hypothetical protein n=1 Tax=Ensifer sp. OV372 TaxID=1855293 RepID=UPI0008E81C30|nr:hypothetical protein [Ensifer sp. OV372]SFH22939.1 hypothetical protein SAMN05216459_1216 [Ensifer sp. OV372]